MSVNIGDEVKAFQKLHPFLSFEESWNYVRAAHPEFENSIVESRRIAAKLAPQREDEARQRCRKSEGSPKDRCSDNPLEPHPLTALFPELPPKELTQLARDIKERGQRERIWRQT
jgi:hypothetical protein